MGQEIAELDATVADFLRGVVAIGAGRTIPLDVMRSPQHFEFNTQRSGASLGADPVPRV
jgi:hypothetical protein